MRIITVVNNKGGVGKTTITKLIGEGLSLIGKKVLLIDNDKQHNLTNRLLPTTPKEKTIRDIYQLKNLQIANRLLSEIIRDTSIENLYLIPSSSTLAYGDVQDFECWKKIFSVSSAKNFFDFVVFDNPPGSESLQHASLVCADTVLIPTQLATNATEGLYEFYIWLESLGFKKTQIKIIPNGYKRWNRYNNFLEITKNMFPISVIPGIPYDEIYDELDAEKKVLYLSRLKHKATPIVIKILTEIFPDLPCETDLLNQFEIKSKNFLSLFRFKKKES